MTMSVQVEPEHYSFESYDGLPRWCSYWYQIKEALALSPKRVLEVGPGSGVFTSYLRGRGIDVKTVDIDATRKPDFVCSVDAIDRDLPADLKFDIVCVFQVLEHLPHDRFDQCLSGLARRGRYCLLSLPHFGFSARFSVAFAGVKVSLGTRMPKPWSFRKDQQHEWELDFRKHSVAQTTHELEKHFKVLNSYHIKENTYHRLWVLQSLAF